MKYRIVFSFLLLLCANTSILAQRDIDTFMHKNSQNKLKEYYGEPLSIYSFEGEGGIFTSLTYPGMYATVSKKNNCIDGISFWTKDLCILSTFIPNGIKVGDNITKYKDIDFSKIITGTHYEKCGIIPLQQEYKIYPTGRVMNYGILSKGIPYFIHFAVENDIIKEIFISHLDDYTE